MGFRRLCVVCTRRLDKHSPPQREACAAKVADWTTKSTVVVMGKRL